jgi:threonylcarbamoyladenosine tRNA methylthiotransferase CDKAL1
MADLDDLEDIGGALAADGVRVTRDLPPVVKVRARVKPASSGTETLDETEVRASDSFGDATEDSARATFVKTSEGDGTNDLCLTSDGRKNHDGESDIRPGRATVHVKTFGCSHNVSDSEFMAGQLSAYGYDLSDNPDAADVWVVNTCTVKNPSQSAMNTTIQKAKTRGKKLVVAGCVPQGDQHAHELDGLSVVGITQIDRIVEVVERTLNGDTVRLLSKKALPSLDLPKVRRNKHVEILPLSTGCLGACTYCKTKHARGDLGSYAPEALVARVRTSIAEGVTEIWLSSEDTGAYGIDLGTDVTRLLRDVVNELPSDGSCMLRLGMTNPPYILAHLDAVARAMRHPGVYAFLHVPVQAASDAVLENMKREYTLKEFETVCDYLLKHVPGITLATDIICGFPGETEDDWNQTMALCRKYEFREVHVSQFYPRPGTPAARLKRVDTKEVKRRSRELTSYIESYSPHAHLLHTTQRVWVSDVAKDGVSLVGHTKSYEQVLLSPADVARFFPREDHPSGPLSDHPLMGRSCVVKITSVARWHAVGKMVEILHKDETRKQPPASAKEAMRAVPRTGKGKRSNPHFGLSTGDAAKASAALARENATQARLETRVKAASRVAFIGLFIGIMGLTLASILSWVRENDVTRV